VVTFLANCFGLIGTESRLPEEDDVVEDLLAFCHNRGWVALVNEGAKDRSDAVAFLRVGESVALDSEGDDEVLFCGENSSEVTCFGTVPSDGTALVVVLFNIVSPRLAFLAAVAFKRGTETLLLVIGLA